MLVASIVDAFPLKDLLERLHRIAGLPEHERKGLADVRLRDVAFPIDLLPIAGRYETEAAMASTREAEDDRTRYYGFWQLFRAASIRLLALQDGEVSHRNRLALSDSFRQLSALMLDFEKEGEKFVIAGDLAFAEQCAESALSLIRPGDPAEAYCRAEAAEQLDAVGRVCAAVRIHPERFVHRPRFGPFNTRRVSADELFPSQ